MKMMKSLFSQFTPKTMNFLPLKMMSSCMAMSWIFMKFSSKSFPGKMKYIWKKMLKKTKKLMFQKSKKKTAPWMPILITMFFIMLSMKLTGLLPYAFTVTSHISFTYSIATPLWLSMKILGFFISFKYRLSHLVPQGTPWYLMPLMMWMESMSLMAQPMALGLRLAAKLTAGHLLMFLLSTAAWTMKKIFMSTMTTIILMLLFMLEVAVACIQAYVFTSLMKFYMDQKM